MSFVSLRSLAFNSHFFFLSFLFMVTLCLFWRFYPWKQCFPKTNASRSAYYHSWCWEPPILWLCLAFWYLLLKCLFPEVILPFICIFCFTLLFHRLPSLILYTYLYIHFRQPWELVRICFSSLHTRNWKFIVFFHLLVMSKAWTVVISLVFFICVLLFVIVFLVGFWKVVQRESHSHDHYYLLYLETRSGKVLSKEMVL